MKVLDKHREILLLSMFIAPFALSISLIEFSIPLKYDLMLENLPLFGAITSFAWLLGSFTVLSVGDLVDKIGSKRMVVLGSLAVLGGGALFALTHSVLWTTFGVLVWAIGYQAVTIPFQSYIFSEFPRNYRGSALGIYYSFFCLAYAAAPLLAFYIITNYSIDFAIMFGALAVVPTLFVRMKPLRKRYEDFGRAIREVVKDDGIVFKEMKDIAHLGHPELSLLLNQFIFGFWYVTMAIGAPLLFFVGEGDLLKSALLMFAFVFPFAFIDLIFGRMSDNPLRRKKFIYFGMAGAGLFMLGFYFVQDFPLMLLFAALTTISLDIAWIANDVAVSDYLPARKRGEFMGVFSLGRELGYDFAPVFYGMLTLLGLKFPFFAAALLVLFGWGYFSIHFLKKSTR